MTPQASLACVRHAEFDESHAAAVSNRQAVAALYDEHYEFLWRALWRLGVGSTSIDDAVHDVFLVVFRRLPDFEHRSSIRSWLYGIALRVAMVYRRNSRRSLEHDQFDEDLVAAESSDPQSERERLEAAKTVQHILQQMDEPLRLVFTMIELEQFSAPEVAEVLRISVNTVYSRLRLARTGFERALARLEAQRRRQG